MGHRDPAAEPDHAAGGDEIFAAPRPQIIDPQVDGADVGKMPRRRLFGFLVGFPSAFLASDASAMARPPTTSSVAEITPPCRIWRTGLPTSSGRISNRRRGALGSSESSLSPSTRLNGIICSKVRPICASMLSTFALAWPYRISPTF